jgi:hypothetical protein
MYSISFLKRRPPVYNAINSKYFYVYCKVEHRAMKTYGDVNEKCTDAYLFDLFHTKTAFVKCIMTFDSMKVQCIGTH